MVELRKRKTPPQPEPPSKKAKTAPKPSKPSKALVAAAAKISDTSNGAAANLKTPSKILASSSEPSTPAVRSTLPTSVLSLSIQTQDSTTTTLSVLLDQSKAGLVLFTYPRASTPGCTTQACLFRDSYTPLTASGLNIYGLSRDSPKSNSTFKTKQNLPFDLLCDTRGEIINALGMAKAGAKTARGVVVLGKSGEVLAWELGGPARTVDVVREVVRGMGEDASQVPGQEEVEGSERKEVETGSI